MVTPVPNQSINTSPLQGIPRNYLLLGLFFLALVVIAADVLVFMEVNKRFRVEGWQEMRTEKDIPEIYPSTGIVYRLEGTLVESKNLSVVLEVAGVKREFPTPGAKFTLVSPFQKFEEWPTKIIAGSTRSDLAPGDKVILLLRGQQLANEFFTERVMKVQTQ